MADKFNVDPGVRQAPNLSPGLGGIGGNPGNVGSGISDFLGGIGGLLSGISQRQSQANVTAINARVNADNILPDTVDRLPPGNTDASTVPVAQAAPKAPVEGGSVYEAPTTGTPDANGGLPVDAQSGMTSLGNKYEAYKQGKMEATNFWGMVSTQYRDMVSKNPAYTKEIADAYKKAYGFDPQHKYLEEWQKAQDKKESELKDEEKRWRDDKEKGAKLGITADVLNKADSDPSVRQKVKTEILTREAGQATTKAQMEALSLKKAQGEDTQNEEFKVASKAIYTEVNNAFTDVTDNMNVNGGISMTSINKKKREALSDGVISPQEMAELKGMMDQFSVSTKERAWRSMGEYIGKFPTDKLRELEKVLDDRIAFYQGHVLSGNTGILEHNEKVQKAAQAGDAYAVMQQSPTMRGMGAARIIGGDSAVNMMITQQNPTALKNEAAGIRLKPMYEGVVTGQPLSGVLREHTRDISDKDKAVAAQAALDGSTKALIDPKTTPEVAGNVAKSLFGKDNKDFIETFAPNSRTKAFGTVVNPSMTAKIEELGKSNPEVVRQYKDWAKTSFMSTMKTHMDTLNGQFSNGMGNSTRQAENALVIGFDGTQFTVSVNPEKAKIGNSGRLVSLADPRNTAATPIGMNYAIEAVREMNRAINIMTPVLSLGEKDADIKKLLDPVLGSMGLNGVARSDLEYVAQAYNQWKLSEEQINDKVGTESKLPDRPANVAENPRTGLGTVKTNVADMNSDASDTANLEAFTSTRERPVLGASPPSEWGKPMEPIQGTVEAPVTSQATPVAKGGSTPASKAPSATTAPSSAPVVTRARSNPQNLRVQTETEANNNPMIAGYIMPTDGSFTPSDVVSTPTVPQSNIPSRGGVADSNYSDLMTYMRKTKGAESKGDVNAKNERSSATGLYQFTTETWKDMIRKYPNLGLTANGRNDPAQQEKAMAAFTRENEAGLKASGIPINDGSRYLAHFAGIGGAKAVWKADPNRSVQETLNEMKAGHGNAVIKANTFLKGKSNAWLINWANRKMK